MRKAILFLILILSASGLFAEEILYQKTHKNFNDITVVSLVEQEKDWYFIGIVIAENQDAVDKYLIYHTDKNVLQPLLFQFEKDNYYVERIEKMEKEEQLIQVKESTDIQNNIIFNTKTYLYFNK